MEKQDPPRSNLSSVSGVGLAFSLNPLSDLSISILESLQSW